MTLVLKYIIRNLTLRPFISILVLTSMTTIGGVAAGILSARFGLTKALHPATHPTWALVTSPDVDSEADSTLASSNLNMLTVGPEIARFSPEVVVAATTIGVDEKVDIFSLRAVEPVGYTMHGVEVIEGRMPSEGAMEFMVGDVMRQHYAWLVPGATIDLMNMRLTCVGVFRALGFMGGEVWMSRKTILQSPDRTALSVIYVETKSPADLDAYIARINGMRGVHLQAQRESDFYQALVGTFSNVSEAFNFVFAFVLCGGMLAAGCVIGVLQLGRIAEMCVMRAIGFHDSAIARLLLFESALIVMAGGTTGVLAALAILRGFVMHANSAGVKYSPINFEAAVTWQSGGLTLGLMLGVAIVGAIFSIIRMMQLPITRGLREE